MAHLHPIDQQLDLNSDMLRENKLGAGAYLIKPD